MEVSGIFLKFATDLRQNCQKPVIKTTKFKVKSLMVMKIERPIYMQQLIDSKDNGLIKIVTGLRRVGKSYLLNRIFCRVTLLLSFVAVATRYTYGHLPSKSL